MSPFLKILVIVVTAYVVEACHGCTGMRNGGPCFNRRKRETRVEDVLLKFDIRLTENLADEIKDMNESEKTQFIQDLENMNNAVKIEAADLRANNDGAMQTPEEFLRAVSDKIAQDFRGKKWFNRLRSIAGDQIAKLLKEMQKN